jgi:Raf kinase inhibitor-like YbhB/YbcL family protein
LFNRLPKNAANGVNIKFLQRNTRENRGKYEQVGDISRIASRLADSQYRWKSRMAFALVSPAFQPMQSIPSQYTCDGADISPPIQWSGIPENTASLVLIVDDPDAPDPQAPKRTWVHWLLYNLPPEAAELPEAVAPSELPDGTQLGINDWRHNDYGGPCPPIGRHRYFFRLYALDMVLPPLGTPTKASLLAAMEGHVLAMTELVGTYEKHK